MARKGYVFTPARRAALAKARAARSRTAKTRRSANRRHYSSNINKRGKGVAGLVKNATPYARVNQRSQTVGFNTGTVLPFTSKRIAFGGYVRLEGTSKQNRLSRNISKSLDRVAPKGSAAGGVRGFINKNVSVTPPAVRANLGGTQVRLGTSRGAGATIIVRRGKHKATIRSSQSGVAKYHKRAGVLSRQTQRKARKQRRGKKK